MQEIAETGRGDEFEPLGVSQIDSDEFRPTDAQPGSKAKPAVMTERVRRGFPLWHPDDNSPFNNCDPEDLERVVLRSGTRNGCEEALRAQQALGT